MRKFLFLTHYLILVCYSVNLKAKSRDFFQETEKLIQSFSQDLANRTVKCEKNISLIQFSTNETLPRSFNHYIRKKIVEAIRTHSNFDYHDCLSCSKKVDLRSEHITLTFPKSNSEEVRDDLLDRGVSNILQGIFIYSRDDLSMNLSCYHILSNSLLWSKTYRSDPLPDHSDRLKQKKRLLDKKAGEINYLVGLGGGALPNIDQKLTAMASFKLGFAQPLEYYRYRFSVNLRTYYSSLGIVGKYPSDTPESTQSQELTREDTLTPFTQGWSPMLSLAKIYKTDNEVYQYLTGSAGVFIASGYFAGLAGLEWETLFDDDLLFTVGLLIVAPTQVAANGITYDIPAGAGYDISVSYIF